MILTQEPLYMAICYNKGVFDKCFQCGNTVFFPFHYTNDLLIIDIKPHKCDYVIDDHYNKNHVGSMVNVI